MTIPWLLMYNVGCITKSVTFFFIFQLGSHVNTLSFGCGHLGFPSYPLPPPHPPKIVRTIQLLFMYNFGSIILLFLVAIIYYLAIKSFVRTLSSGGSHLEFPIGTKSMKSVHIITEWVQISMKARCTILCDKVGYWLVTGRWFSPDTPPIKLTATI